MKKREVVDTRRHLLENTYASIYDELVERLEIDKDSLDDDLRTFADAYYRIADAVAVSATLRDESKAKLQEVEADVSERVRQELTEAGVKFTVDQVRQSTMTRPSVTKARTRYQQDVYQHNRWSALKEAWDKRSFAIHNMVELYTSQYYSVQRENTSGRKKRHRR